MTLADVARRLDLVAPAVMYYFKSKEELFLTMLDQKFADEIERMERALSGTGDPGDTL